MATWASGVRAAQKVIEDVEECLVDNGIFFQEITLYPFRSNGGRSNGVSAVFNYVKDEVRKHVSISVYEHWNTDHICIKVDSWVPTAMQGEKHDVPDVEFRQNELQHVVYGIQSFLLQYFGISFPKEWNVPCGFKGNSSLDDDKLMDYVDDKMMPVIVDWCEPPEDDDE
jgi:hypothetical protein